MKVNRRLKGELVLKRLSEPPIPQLSPQWLINTKPTFSALHPLYFLSFFPFHITEPHSVIFILPSAFIFDQIFLIAPPPNPSCSPSLSFVFFKTRCPLPSYLPRSPSLSTPLRHPLLLHVPSLLLAPIPPPFF